MSWSTDKGHRVKLSFVGPESISRTHQSFAKDADINVLMGRYKSPDLLAHAMSLTGSQRRPMFGDFSSIPDYMQVRNQMALADQAFASLPSNVRDRFRNNVSECLDFLADPKNVKEAVDLGLLDKAALPVQPAVPVPSVIPDGAPAPAPEPTPPKAVS